MVNLRLDRNIWRTFRRGQISFEYVVIMGFVTFILIGILSYAFIYGAEVQDKMRMTQITNYGNKVVSSAESVFYAGEPSKLTVEVYLPENVRNLTIQNNTIVASIESSSGFNVLTFESSVPMSGTLSHVSGIKKIELTASSGEVVVS